VGSSVVNPVGVVEGVSIWGIVGVVVPMMKGVGAGVVILLLTGVGASVLLVGAGLVTSVLPGVGAGVVTLKIELGDWVTTIEGRAVSIGNCVGTVGVIAGAGVNILSGVGARVVILELPGNVVGAVTLVLLGEAVSIENCEGIDVMVGNPAFVQGKRKMKGIRIASCPCETRNRVVILVHSCHFCLQPTTKGAEKLP
jgi:hypothetical protein